MERESLQPELGARLRSIRRERGLKLTDVSEATGISASFLSLVESGKNDLTITRLARLCRFYELSILEVLPPVERPDAIILRRGTHQHFFSQAEGIEVFLLAPDTNRLMMPVTVEIDPGGALSEFIDYPGDLFLIVTEGGVEMRIDEMQPARLEQGDAVYLTAGRRYSYGNPDPDRSARLLVVLSPPSGRTGSAQQP